jgi:hypothetical protein
MNVVCFRELGNVYMCEFRNDFDKINDALANCSASGTISAMYNDLVLSYTDEKWNDYVMKVIESLNEAGFEVVWDE